MRGVNVVLLLTIACIFASSTFAQAPIKKPEKKQQTTAVTTTTQQRQNNTTTTKPAIGTINGHEWVDLGLSVKWATCNVGASSPSDYGNYYAWGEISTKSEYMWENSKTWGKDTGSIAGNPQYDAARANWGSTWRLPTAYDIDELVNKCTRTWTSQGGHNGYKITGPNGKSIFIPAAGCCANDLYYAGEIGVYWSATPDGDDACDVDVRPSKAYDEYVLYFHEYVFRRGWGYRERGAALRPVSE